MDITSRLRGIFHSTMLFVFVIIIFLGPLLSGCTHLYDSQRLLRDKLANYTAVFRPIFNQSKPLDLVVAFDLVSIQDFDERESKFTVTGVLQCFWMDEVFTWDPDDYGGVEYLQVDSSYIWMPKLTLANPVNDLQKMFDDWQLVYIQHTGSVVFQGGGVFSVSCDLDVTYYPWDNQYCELWFMIWGYSSNQIHIIQYFDKLMFTFYTGHGMWTVTGSKTHVVEDASIAAFGIHLERQPRFILVNVLSPIIIMSFLNVLIFLIPSESGERISYSITVLLAIAVFLTLIGEHLPKTSDPMSNISYYLLAILSSSVCMTLLNIISLRMFYTDEKENVGSFWRCFTIVFRCRCRHKTRTRKPRPTNNTPSIYSIRAVTQDSKASTISKPNVTRHGGFLWFEHDGVHTDDHVIGDSEKNADYITWVEVSKTFDHTCFVVFLAALVFFNIVFMFTTSSGT